MKKRYVLKKEKRKQRLIALAVLLVVILLIVFGISKVVNSGEYHNERSFTKFAKAYDKQYSKQQDVENSDTTVTYGEPLSTSVNVPVLAKKYKTQDMQKAYQGDVADFKKTYAALTEKDRAALLISYEQFKTPKKVTGVALHEQTYVKKKGEDETNSAETVRTFNFANKTGVLLTMPQVFKGDYLKALTTQTTEALKKDYKSVNAQAIAKNQALLENFVMTEDGVRFYFAPGTVCDKSEGTVSTELSYEDLKAYVRKDIGNRVVDPNKPMVALTFDDGPDPKWTPRILNALAKNNGVATFFELGQNVDQTKNADKILQRELEIGCEVGSHSYNHPDLLSLSKNQVAQQAKKSKASIKKACGQEPTVFRGPYGNSSQNVTNIFGLPEYNWSVDTLDWKLKNKNAIVRHVESIKNLDGQIILMHSIYKTSAQAAEELVPWLVDQGYQLVTVSELIEYKYGKDPKKAVNHGYTFMN